MEINNVINPSTEIEPKELSYELKKLVTEYINDVKTKNVNYNLYLHTKPILVLDFLEENLDFFILKVKNNTDIIIYVLYHKLGEYHNLELAIDYLNNKCYLLNTHPYNTKSFDSSYLNFGE